MRYSTNLSHLKILKGPLILSYKHRLLDSGYKRVTIFEVQKQILVEFFVLFGQNFFSNMTILRVQMKSFKEGLSNLRPTETD